MRRKLSFVRNSASLVTHASVRCENVVFAVLGELMSSGAWQAAPEEAWRPEDSEARAAHINKMDR